MKSHVLTRLFIPIVIALAGGTFWGCAENAGASETLPKILVVGGDTVDWGEVGGGELKHSIKIVNAGGDTLKITEVKPSCGCTTAPVDKEMLFSGDTATINVTMDVAGKTGDQMKTLRITTNDSTSPVTTVYLKAKVTQEIVAEPAYFNVFDVIPGQEGSSAITLRNVGKEPVIVQPPKEQDVPLMAVRFSMLQPVTLKPNDSLVVTAYATPLNAGSTQARYIFATNSKRTPEIKVSLAVSTKADSPTGIVESPQVTTGKPGR